MKYKSSVDDLSVSELKELLHRKKQVARQQRMQRLKGEGRVVDIAELPPPNSTPPPLIRPRVIPTGTMRYTALGIEPDEVEDIETEWNSKSIQWRWISNKLLLFIEIAAVLGLAFVMFRLWNTQQELNQELAQTQRAEAQSLALPTPTVKPVIGVAILPTGHRFIEGSNPVPEESGDIPEHLLPSINAFEPPPFPESSPEQARRIQIPAIGVDSLIVEGVYDWEQLKKGVGHQIGSAQPGELGNIVLAAHNDIYGEIFRHLDKLTAGDMIIISSERRSYTYIVNEIKIVDPIEGVWVMAPTEHASTTLISCYPYRVNTERIAVFADLVEESVSQ
jgi:sortase A